jgi:hypothetical protein
MEGMMMVIPRRFTKTHKVHWWGGDYQVTPAVCDEAVGDGCTLLYVQCLNTRPYYYLIRVDSSWGSDGRDEYDDIEEVLETLEDCFGEKERERENLADDLREQGIEPDGDNTDLAGNEDRLGWPVLSLDSGYTWGVVARQKSKRWMTV